MGSIIALETDLKRIAWLVNVVSERAVIYTAFDSQSFLGTYSFLGTHSFLQDLKLVIIGLDSQPEEVLTAIQEGLTFPCPVLVWSNDPDGVDTISAVLMQNSIQCIIMPYYPHTLASIKQLINTNLR